MKKLLQKISVKGVFNTVFPKAENTKIGKFVSGVIQGGTAATPLSFIQEFAKGFFDLDGDGEITAKDFKDMTAKQFGMAIGFLVVMSAIVYFITGAL
jgi:hypothetical protein